MGDPGDLLVEVFVDQVKQAIFEYVVNYQLFLCVIDRLHQLGVHQIFDLFINLILLDLRQSHVAKIDEPGIFLVLYDLSDLQFDGLNDPDLELDCVVDLAQSLEVVAALLSVLLNLRQLSKQVQGLLAEALLVVASDELFLAVLVVHDLQVVVWMADQAHDVTVSESCLDLDGLAVHFKLLPLVQDPQDKLDADLSDVRLILFVSLEVSLLIYPRLLENEAADVLEAFKINPGQNLEIELGRCLVDQECHHLLRQ